MLGDIIFGTLGLMDDMTNGLLGDTAAVGCAVVAEMIPDTPATPEAIAAAVANVPAPDGFNLPSSLTARGAMLARLIDKTVKFESELPYQSDKYSECNYGSSVVNEYRGIGRIVNVKYDKAKKHSDTKVMEFVIIEIPVGDKDQYIDIRGDLVHKKFLVDRTQIVSIVNLLEGSDGEDS